MSAAAAGLAALENRPPTPVTDGRTIETLEAEPRAPIPRTRAERARRVLALVLAVAATGCASYPARTSEALASFERGQFETAEVAYCDPDTAGSPFLTGAESGMVSLTAGDWQHARSRFEHAASAVKEIEDRALVSAEDLGESLLSWAVNDTLSAYHGEGYERVALHAALALTYVATGQLEDVAVETKRANKLLESEEQLYDKKYKAGGLAHFLSALAYEMLGEFDNAYIDYERMEEKGVGIELAGRALVRIATKLHYDDERERWVQAYGADLERPKDAASIVLVAGVGLGPFKQEHVLSIETKDGLLQWSVPSFVARPQSVRSLSLRVTGSGAVRTSVLEDVGVVASENLEDRIAWLAVKSTVRTFLKRELTKHLEKDHEFLGRLAGDLFNFLTEHADLRSWQTLPDSWQAARLFVAPGRHEIAVDAEGGENRVLGTFELDPGETMIVIARTLGPRLYAQPIGGLRVDRGPIEDQAPLQDGAAPVEQSP